MKLKPIAITALFLLATLLYACNNDSSQSTASKPESNNNDEDIATLEPYLDEQVFETHSNGEYKIGLYSETNGQGTFEDCKTGKTYTIDIRKDASLLHSTYLALSQDDEQILMVELVGEIQTDKNEVSRLQTQKLLSIIHLTSCP